VTGESAENQVERGNRFKAMHERNTAFVIPNPWDVGSAKLFEALGFEALATTSAGYAQTLGRLDGLLSVDEKLNHCRALCAATSLPVSADLENCFADSPEGVAAVLTRAAETGLVGASIEDYTNDDSRPMYEFNHAVERVQAAVEATRKCDFHFTLTARAEGLLRRRHDMDEVMRRLVAFEQVGADVLYAPALRTLDQIKTVVAGVRRPVNVLTPMCPDLTVAELSAAGVKRLSIGAALARAMMGGVLAASDEMLGAGTFSWATKITHGSRMNQLLGAG
jgi:2-methylisocitrate lyase-like PEP mutase family enzyme